MNEQHLQLMQGYFDLMTMNGGSHVFRQARNHGIFEALARGPGTAAEIAGRTGLDERALGFLLPVLCELGCAVSADGQVFGPSPLMGLLTGDYANLSDNYWAHLPEFLATGTPFKAMDDVGESEAHYVQQVKALEWMMAPSAAALAAGAPEGALDVLDVGAGSGVWGLSLIARHPESHLTVADWPAITKIALASAAEKGLGDRTSSLDGNFHESTYPEAAYDVALIANVAHLETPSGLTGLLQRLRPALKPGGAVWIVDVFAGHERGSLAARMYSLGLALRTRQGIAHSAEALDACARKAGFTGTRFRALEAVPYTMGVVIAAT